MKISLSYTIMALVLFFLTTCKEKEESENPAPGEIRIAENVKVINDQLWDENFVSIDTVNYIITFSSGINASQSFKPGDIIMTSKNEGLLRKVKAVSETNDLVLVETDTAYLTDVVKQGQFEFDQALTTSMIKSIDYNYPGMILKTSDLKAPNQTMLEWDFNIVLYDYDNNQQTTGDQIKLLGDLSCNWNLSSKIVIDFWKGLTEASFGFQSSENLNLQLVAGLQYSFEKKYTLATVNFTPITVFIGFVPIVFTPQMKIIAGLDGYANASVTSEVTQSLSFNAGVKYLKNSGWAPFKTFTKTLDFQPPQLNMNAGASAYIKPEITVKLYGLAGPYANLKIYGKLNANLLETPWWEFYAGMAMNAGVKASILDRFVLDFAVNNIIKYEFKIGEATSPPLELPELFTSNISEIGQASAKGGGVVISDGGATVISRGICWNTSHNPTTSNNHTSNGTGVGQFSSNLTGLSPNTTYYVRSYGTNSEGTAYGNEVSFTTSDITTVTDYDGNIYNIKTIGNQIWMAENLKTTHFSNGTAIPLVTSDTLWASLTNEAYCYYNSDINSISTYGLLYNWPSINKDNLCPNGWHVPTDSEWTILSEYLGGEAIAGGKLKETGTSHWFEPNSGATNETGFTALPGGYRNFNGVFTLISYYGLWWTNSSSDADNAWYRTMSYDLTNIHRDPYNKKSGFSVRCIKN